MLLVAPPSAHAAVPSMLTSFAWLMAANAFGVDVQTIAIGCCFSVLGLLGRIAFDMQRALEAGDKLRLIQTLGWAAAGFLGAPFITILWIIILRAIGLQTDTTTVIGLLFFGFSGSKGVSQLIGAVGGMVSAQLSKLGGTPKTGS